MSSIPDKNISVLIRPFFAQPGGPDRVFVTSCCDRTLVSTKRPGTCRTCGKVPNVQEVTRQELD
jgi:hypothetical protein